MRVTGRTTSAQTLRAQLLYLTRDGRLDLMSSGNGVIRGKEAINALRDEWLEANAVYARSPQGRSQSVAVVLSMPTGTPIEAVERAAHAWAREHFSPMSEWAAATHTDRSHPHVHTAIRAVKRDGYRLDIKLADVQDWRETFARELRSMGIEADATPRRDQFERRLAERDREPEREAREFFQR